MTMRVLIAGLLGALAMYVWNSVAHMSPIGMIGFKTLPAGTLSQTMTTELGANAGLYAFPDPDGPDGKYDPKLLEERLKAGPQGFVIYHPAGTIHGMSPTQLIVEFGLELVQSVIAALLVSLSVVASFWKRVGVVLLLSLPVALATNGSYWNWYGFPADMTLAAMLLQLVGYGVAALAIAGWLGRKPKAA